MTYGLEGRCSIQLSYWRPIEERILSTEGNALLPYSTQYS